MPGTLLPRQLRRRDAMPLARLAAAIRVPEDELLAIEDGRRVMPKPRTLHQLAVHHEIAPRALLRPSPATAERDARPDEAAVCFTASPDTVARPAPEERDRLNAFIKALSRDPDQSAGGAE